MPVWVANMCHCLFLTWHRLSRWVLVTHKPFWQAVIMACVPQDPSWRSRWLVCHKLKFLVTEVASLDLWLELLTAFMTSALGFCVFFPQWNCVAISTVELIESVANCINNYLSVGPTGFRGLQNFEPSRGICRFPWNFDVAAEFYRS